MTRSIFTALALAFTSACIGAERADTADSFDRIADSEDTADAPQVAFAATCDSAGYWTITPEAQAAVWDNMAIEVHGVVVGGLPSFWSWPTTTTCEPIQTPFTCADTWIQVRVRLELDGADIATACSAGQSAWASCPETLPPVCP
jgi:hypothetical protein